MNENLFSDRAIEQRAKLLEQICVRMEDQLVKRYFTPDDIEQLKNELVEHSIELQKLIDELKIASAPIKEEIKIANNNISIRVSKLNNKFEENSERVYMIDNQETGTMNCYDSAGYLLSTRALTPQEKQTRIIPPQTK